MLISADCRCGKRVLGTDIMAGEEAQCPLCGCLVRFPTGTAELAPDPFEVACGTVAVTDSVCLRESAPVTALPQATAPPRAARDYLYWVLLLALLPLLSCVVQSHELTLAQRLEKTLDAHPEARPAVQRVLNSRNPTLDRLLLALPGQRLDATAYLPRNSRAHWGYAAATATGYFLLMRFLLARRLLNAWLLPLVGLFTATLGIGFLIVLEGLVGRSFRFALDPEVSLLANVLGFTCGVGLCEELCKALPLLWYSRMKGHTTWQGACLWGMASGVGFGVAEAITYSSNSYNGIAPGEAYLTRFISCVALHAVWSASVGITIFQSRREVAGVLGALIYDGGLDWKELLLPLLWVLGVAMILHGLYDALLTQEMVAPALLVALLSFAWLGWQIESCREADGAAATEVVDA